MADSRTAGFAERGIETVIVEPGRGLARLGLPELWRYRLLLGQLTLRALRGRYRPTWLGRSWILLRPGLLCAVYVLVFGVLLGVETDPVPFPLFVFSGIGLFWFFSSALSETANSLVSSAGSMSKTYYPRLIAPLTAMAANSVDLLATLGVVAAMMLLYGVVPGWNALLAPLLVLAIVTLTLGAGLTLAALAVRVRDVSVGLPVAMRVILYASPCTYPASLIPEPYRALYFLNPFAAFLQAFRWAAFGDAAPPLWSVALGVGLMGGLLLFGLYRFHRVERTLVDVL
jgi:lipopolysaccharide transport system permease protein